MTRRLLLLPALALVSLSAPACYLTESCSEGTVVYEGTKSGRLIQIARGGFDQQARACDDGLCVEFSLSKCSAIPNRQQAFRAAREMGAVYFDLLLLTQQGDLSATVPAGTAADRTSFALKGKGLPTLHRSRWRI